MLVLIRELLSYDFVIRAFIVGGLISVCAALLGVSLVLKRYSMIGDGLSHVGFGTLSVALSLNLAPLQISVPVVLLAAFMLLRISENSSIKGDAAIAIISSSSLAIGIIAVSMTSGMNIDVYNYMFGTVLAMDRFDLYMGIVLAVIVLALYIIFYNKIFLVTFDENFAAATGTKTHYYNMLIALLTALVIVIGMRLMGAMLISSLIIFPALASMRVFSCFHSVVISSAVVSILCFFVGMTVSFICAAPTGASIVVVNLIMFCIFSGVGFLIKR